VIGGVAASVSSIETHLSRLESIPRGLETSGSNIQRCRGVGVDDRRVIKICPCGIVSFHSDSLNRILSCHGGDLPALARPSVDVDVREQPAEKAAHVGCSVMRLVVGPKHVSPPR